jgi:hypothetical protein
MDKEEYIADLARIDRLIEANEAAYKKTHHELIQKFAETYEEGKLEADLALSELQEPLGKTRQTLNRRLVKVYGVRQPEKVKAAHLGHESRRQKLGAITTDTE